MSDCGSLTNARVSSLIFDGSLQMPGCIGFSSTAGETSDPQTTPIAARECKNASPP